MDGFIVLLVLVGVVCALAGGGLVWVLTAPADPWREFEREMRAREGGQ